MKQQNFPLETVLAVVFDRALSANSRNILQLCSFLIGSQVSPEDLLKSLHNSIQLEIFKQHPELAAIDISVVTENNYWMWLTEQKFKFGVFITLTTLY